METGRLSVLCSCSCLLSLLLLSGVLCLLEHDEEYVFTLPSAYARSILTVPWVELGGKVSISCVKSGYSATVTFHTKPFYGGKVHRWGFLLLGWGGMELQNHSWLDSAALFWPFLMGSEHTRMISRLVVQLLSLFHP